MSIQVRDTESVSSSPKPKRKAPAGRKSAVDGKTSSAFDASEHVDRRDLSHLLEALRAARGGDFSVRLTPNGDPQFAEVARAFNELLDRNDRMSREIFRVGKIIGREGRMTERFSLAEADGEWARSVDSLNALIDDLVRPTTEVARVIVAVAEGDLTQKMALKIGGQPVKGEFLRIGTTVNTMVEQLRSFAAEVTRVAREVGTEGKLGGQAEVAGVSGTWRDLTENVNLMAANLTDQVRNIAQVTTAVAQGDLSQKITVEAKGEVAALADTINSMTDTLRVFAEQVTTVAREVGTEGKLGGQAEVAGVAGTWKDLTESVNFMASNLTDQVRNIAQVTTAVAQGDLSQKITVEAKGEVAALADTINSMTDTLRVFGEQVTTVAREVGTEGKLGGQAAVPGVAGTWKDLTDSVNFMAANLTDQVRNIAQVTTAVAQGDLSQKITVDVKGEILELKNTINTMVDQLSSFADEVTTVAREVGTEGKLGGQAEVAGVSGTWRSLTESVNGMAANLTDQVRNIAQVTTAVAQGDLSQKITVEAKGEVAALADTINTMVDQLRSFAAEVTRVAREVGTEGELGGQAEVAGVSGTWRGLTESVNGMAANLTDQVRNIAQVTTAVAQGDLSQKITVDAKGEILELKDTINTMVDQLSSFADEVTRVAREVGTEGKLGGQAEVAGVSGTWRDLTENVNQLAGNLTTQVRAIAEVSTAVTQGDLTRSISVEAQGEVAELKDNINQMIANLRDTTTRNQDTDWLKTNLARISSLMQGQRDLATVSQLIMSELTPSVTAQHGAFFLLSTTDDASDPDLRLIASYGYERRKDVPKTFALGESLVGQAALERKTIRIDDAPEDYIRISSGLGSTRAASIMILPVLFEDQLLGVIELAWLRAPGEIHTTFLEQLMETLGVVLNTIIANMRTEELLEQSQSLNAELEQQAQMLEERNLDIERKNREIEQARIGLEEKAEQLAQSGRYKSEFLANMSHELRTPLNSLLILSKLLLENENGNLTDKQLEFARTIRAAGSDLLELINDILDLSKIEAGKMDLLPAELLVSDISAYVRSTFAPLASDKGLALDIVLDKDLPRLIVTDQQRLQQILRNLLSNAFKFTAQGGVTLRIARAGEDAITFAVNDTGIGIVEDKLAVIFEAFQQADGTTSRTYGGTGLGLSISRELALALGGELSVASVPGVGSTFTLTLRLATFALSVTESMSNGHSAEMPALPALPAPPVASAAPAPPATRPHVLHAITRLLVIDQDGATTDAIRGLIGRDHGVDLNVFSDPAEALLAARAERPDCLVIGPSLSEQDLFELLDEATSEPTLRHLPVILRTAAPLSEDGETRLRGYGSDLLPRVALTDEALAAEAALILHPSTPAVATASGVQPAAGDHSLASLSGRILLVDDDVRNLFALASLLEGRGLEVVFSETGHGALEILDTDADIDLVLMDIMMPQMDGYETIKAVRTRQELQSLPIIAVTAKAMQGDREKSIAAGASDYITKPVDPDKLITMVRGWLNG
ncbi:MAG TPA: HAMP domain-containing protein [Solirubrobacteraceae bacterium]|nr:HAMP domain-containing protein [Solirubrobacteraceae bacterium]